MMKRKQSVRLLRAVATIYLIYVIIDFANYPKVNSFTYVSLLVVLNYLAFYYYANLYSDYEEPFFKVGNFPISKSRLFKISYLFSSAILAIFYPWVVLIAFVSSATLFPVFYFGGIYMRLINVPGSAGKEAKLDDVALGVSSPKAVSSGVEFTARFFAYSPKIEEQLKDVIKQISPKAKIATGIRHCKWKRGTIVKVKLFANMLNVEPAVQSFEWKGRYNILDFTLSVPDTINTEEIILKFEVYISEIKISSFNLDIPVRNIRGKEKIKYLKTSPYRKVFASYASQDREIVLHRVSEIQRNGIKVFLDCLSMKAGELWKESLENEIKNNDSFLLFWSENAMSSEWVTWEWKTALECKGISYIEPHSLTTVDKAPPPDELKSLHFGDVNMLVKEAILKSAPNGGQ